MFEEQCKHCLTFNLYSENWCSLQDEDWFEHTNLENLLIHDPQGFGDLKFGGYQAFYVCYSWNEQYMIPTKGTLSKSLATSHVLVNLKSTYPTAYLTALGTNAAYMQHAIHAHMKFKALSRQVEISISIQRDMQSTYLSKTRNINMCFNILVQLINHFMKDVPFMLLRFLGSSCFLHLWLMTNWRLSTWWICIHSLIAWNNIECDVTMSIAGLKPS